MTELATVFASAAPPQKAVLVIMLVCTVFSATVVLLPASKARRWTKLVSDLRIAGPIIGLLVGAMNSFHMARTVQKLPMEVTAKALAPGVLEVATLIGLGALVGLVAQVALMSTRLRTNQEGTVQKA